MQKRKDMAYNQTDRAPTSEPADHQASRDVAPGVAIPMVTLRNTDSDSSTRSRAFARRGYELCSIGRHQDAVELFTKAIALNPYDHRYFTNRSYCYSALERYDEALKDAEMAVCLEPRMPKCHFRMGQAQQALLMYHEAMQSFKNVLTLDASCEEARRELHAVSVHLVTSMGFTHEQAESSLSRNNGDVQAAVDALCQPATATPAENADLSDAGGCRSLWIGNITCEVTKDMLVRLFRPYGELHSVHTKYDRTCAFINYVEHESAKQAMEALQGHLLGGNYIVIRYPDNKSWTPKYPSKIPSVNSGGVDATAQTSVPDQNDDFGVAKVPGRKRGHTP